MAKAPKSAPQMSPGLAAFAVAAKTNVEKQTPAEFAAQAVAEGKGNEPMPPVTVDKTTGKHEFNPPIKSDAQLLKEDQDRRKADEAAAKDKKAADKAAAAKAKDDAKAAKAAEKAEKQAKADADRAEKAAARATAKAEREARMAELANGRTPGSMLALAVKVKDGKYVKSATGQLHSGDALASALDGISATDVIRIGLDVLKLEDNPYAALNIGQQSMNLRNRIRGAIKKQVLTIADITAYVERNKIVQVTAEQIAKAKAEREAKAAAAKAEREAKAAAKAAPKADTEAAAADATA